MGSRHGRAAGPLAALLAVGLLSGCSIAGTSGASDLPASFSGTPVEDPPVALPTAALIDADGSMQDLRTVSEAPLTLTVFAYTTCLDECPLTVSSIAAALRGLPERERDAVQLVVLSADPARDTPQAMRQWLDRFGGDAVGLTGEPETLTRVARELYVPLELPANVSPAAGVEPDEPAHGVQIWAFGQDDWSRMVWSDSPGPAALRADLSRLVAQELR